MWFNISLFTKIQYYFANLFLQKCCRYLNLYLILPSSMFRLIPQSWIEEIMGFLMFSNKAAKSLGAPLCRSIFKSTNWIQFCIICCETEMNGRCTEYAVLNSHDEQRTLYLCLQVKIIYENSKEQAPSCYCRQQFKEKLWINI